MTRVMSFLYLICLLVGCKATQVLPSASGEKNFVEVREGLFISKYETSNAHYRAFLEDLQASNENMHLANLPDSSKWKDFGLNAFAEYYHKHPGYSHYPAVTISHENAMQYCEWLTDTYNKDPKRSFRKVIIRLPTESEWMEAARGQDEHRVFPWRSAHMRDRKGNYLANFRRVSDGDIARDSLTGALKIMRTAHLVAGSLSDGAPLTTAVTAFGANEDGLFCMAGNVAEMVAEKGITKGGSFNDPGYYCRIQSKQYYTNPSPTIGFRVVMEVIEK